MIRGDNSNDSTIDVDVCETLITRVDGIRNKDIADLVAFFLNRENTTSARFDILSENVAIRIVSTIKYGDLLLEAWEALESCVDLEEGLVAADSTVEAKREQDDFRDFVKDIFKSFGLGAAGGRVHGVDSNVVLEDRASVAVACADALCGLLDRYAAGFDRLDAWSDALLGRPVASSAASSRGLIGPAPRPRQRSTSLLPLVQASLCGLLAADIYLLISRWQQLTTSRRGSFTRMISMLLLSLLEDAASRAGGGCGEASLYLPAQASASALSLFAAPSGSTSIAEETAASRSASGQQLALPLSPIAEEWLRSLVQLFSSLDILEAVAAMRDALALVQYKCLVASRLQVCGAVLQHAVRLFQFWGSSSSPGPRCGAAASSRRLMVQVVVLALLAARSSPAALVRWAIGPLLQAIHSLPSDAGGTGGGGGGGGDGDGDGYACSGIDDATRTRLLAEACAVLLLPSSHLSGPVPQHQHEHELPAVGEDPSSIDTQRQLQGGSLVSVGRPSVELLRAVLSEPWLMAAVQTQEQTQTHSHSYPFGARLVACLCRSTERLLTAHAALVVAAYSRTAVAGSGEMSESSNSNGSSRGCPATQHCLGPLGSLLTAATDGDGDSDSADVDSALLAGLRPQLAEEDALLALTDLLAIVVSLLRAFAKCLRWPASGRSGESAQLALVSLINRAATLLMPVKVRTHAHTHARTQSAATSSSSSSSPLSASASGSRSGLRAAVPPSPLPLEAYTPPAECFASSAHWREAQQLRRRTVGSAALELAASDFFDALGIVSEWHLEGGEHEATAVHGTSTAAQFQLASTLLLRLRPLAGADSHGGLKDRFRRLLKVLRREAELQHLADAPTSARFNELGLPGRAGLGANLFSAPRPASAPRLLSALALPELLDTVEAAGLLSVDAEVLRLCADFLDEVEAQTMTMTEAEDAGRGESEAKHDTSPSVSTINPTHSVSSPLLRERLAASRRRLAVYAASISTSTSTSISEPASVNTAAIAMATSRATASSSLDFKSVLLSGGADRPILLPPATNSIYANASKDPPPAQAVLDQAMQCGWRWHWYWQWRDCSVFALATRRSYLTGAAAATGSRQFGIFSSTSSSSTDHPTTNRASSRQRSDAVCVVASADVVAVIDDILDGHWQLSEAALSRYLGSVGGRKRSASQHPSPSSSSSATAARICDVASLLRDLEGMGSGGGGASVWRQVSGSSDPLTVLVSVHAYVDAAACLPTVGVRVRVVNSSGFKIPGFSLRLLTLPLPLPPPLSYDDTVAGSAVAVRWLSSSAAAGADYFLPGAVVDRFFRFQRLGLGALDVAVRLEYPQVVFEDPADFFPVPDGSRAGLVSQQAGQADDHRSLGARKQSSASVRGTGGGAGGGGAGGLSGGGREMTVEVDCAAVHVGISDQLAPYGLGAVSAIKVWSRRSGHGLSYCHHGTSGMIAISEDDCSSPGIPLSVFVSLWERLPHVVLLDVEVVAAGAVYGAAVGTYLRPLSLSQQVQLALLRRQEAAGDGSGDISSRPWSALGLTSRVEAGSMVSDAGGVWTDIWDDTTGCSSNSNSGSHSCVLAWALHSLYGAEIAIRITVEGPAPAPPQSAQSMRGGVGRGGQGQGRCLGLMEVRCSDRTVLAAVDGDAEALLAELTGGLMAVAAASSGDGDCDESDCVYGYSDDESDGSWGSRRHQ